MYVIVIKGDKVLSLTSGARRNDLSGHLLYHLFYMGGL